MVLLEEYFELHESENPTIMWKVLQLVSYIMAAGFGIWCGYTFALLRINFNSTCFLFSKRSITPQESRIMDEDVRWMHESLCEYCQYSMVSSFIFATIWAAFFLMCDNRGKSITGLPQPWRITVPALIFNLIYFPISFAAALQIQRGISVFCELEDSVSRRWADCTALKQYDKSKSERILVQLQITTKTAWVTAASWLLAFLIPLLRIIFVSDFKLCKISVYKVDDAINQDEETIRVIDYDTISPYDVLDFKQKND